MKSEEKTLTPLVSIVTATYNHAPYIAEALDSFLAQETEYPYEIIVHDDASTDGTTEIVRNYAEKYPDIVKPIFQKTNQYSQGINIYEFIMPHIRGKYIAQCEGDDFWCDKHKLQKQVTYMEQHPECSYCFCNAYKVNTKSKIIGEQSLLDCSRIFSAQEIIMEENGAFPATAGILYKKNDLVSFPPSFILGEVGDLPLRCFLTLRGYAYGFSDKMCCYRIMTPGSWSERSYQDSLRNPEKYLRRVDEFIQFYNFFDQYSNNLYHNEITVKLFQRTYSKNIYLGRWKELNTEPFRKKFKKEPLKVKIKVFLKFYVPVSASIYRKLRSKLSIVYMK